MKGTKKITKLQLENDFAEEYVLLGIVSSDADYKLSLILNKKFGITLKNAAPIRLAEDIDSDLTFSRFTSSNKTSALIFSLISNRSGKDFLFRKLKNIDYILQIYDPDHETDSETLYSDLRNTESVTAVFKVDQNSLKDKNIQYLIQ
jgi:hypothetical protein